MVNNATDLELKEHNDNAQFASELNSKQEPVNQNSANASTLDCSSTPEISASQITDTSIFETNSEWTAVENSEILQPENTVEGDKYIVYIKETKGNDETVDAKFLTCVYKEDAGVDKEEKTIT